MQVPNEEFGNTWFVLCGRGPLMEDLKKKAAERNLSDRIVFAGYRNDVADFYKMADLFIFPSFREGLPVALMEAMASGLKCVASRNRGTNDLLPCSKLLFEADDPEELKEKITIAMTEDCSEELRQNAEILKKFDLSNALKMTRDLYLEETASAGWDRNK